jgi:hypothetical protein
LWKESTPTKGTQLIFLDLGVPRPKAAAPHVDAEDPTAETLDTTSEEDARLQGSVYDDLKKKLIAAGIPSAEIAFIQDVTNDAQRIALFQKVRNGTVRVLIGNTARMGEGMNVQDRLIAQHDMDAPWKPAHIEQRMGRILRPGNQNKEVHVFRYVTEGSFDAYMWQTLERKQRAFGMLLEGTSGARNTTDIGNVALQNFAEATAAASGNPQVMEKHQLDMEIEMLESSRMATLRNQSAARRQRASIPTLIANSERAIAALDADYARYQEAEQAGTFAFALEGKRYTDPEAAGQALIALADSAKQLSVETPMREVGTYLGRPVLISNRGPRKIFTLNKAEPTYQSSATEFTIQGSGGQWSADIEMRAEDPKPLQTIQRFRMAFHRLPDKKHAHEQAIAHHHEEAAKLDTELAKPLPYEEELATLKARLAVILTSTGLGPTTDVGDVAAEEDATQDSPSTEADDVESPRAAYRPDVPRVPGQAVYEPPPGYVTRFAQSKVVDADGALKPVYHGTPEAFQAFDPQRQDPGALYGPGHYFTEEPRIAGGRGLSDDLGYAGSGKGEVVQRFPTYRAASDYVQYTPMVTLGGKNADGQWEVRARFKNPNIRPVYLNIQQPFALDARYDVDQVSALTGRATVFGRMEGWSGHDIYTAIESDTGSKEATNHRLQDLGFDGITHIGGQNTGNPPHRVWIAFHPDQILPVYAPEVSYDRRPASSPGDLVQADQLLLRFEAAARGDLWAASGDVGGTPPAGPGLPGVPSILGARTLGKSLPARAYIDALRSTGAAAFVGQQAKTPHDLAVLAQAVRDPNMERLFWVFMKGHEAVDTLVISSRLPGSSAMFPVTAHPGLSRADHIRLLQQRMKALGADGYYLLHNHPSGDATPSTADRVMTTNIHLDMPGLRGHVVINSGHYTVIGPNGKPYRHQLPPAPDAPPLYGLDPFLEAGPSEVPHPLNSQYIRASSNLATLGQKVNAPDGYVTAFFRSATGQVRGIELIPVSIFTDTMAMEAYAANRALHFGTQEILTYYDGHHPQVPAVARELYARGVLRDHYAPTHAVQSLASTFPGEYASTQQPGMARGEEVTTSGAPPLWRKTG